MNSKTVLNIAALAKQTGQMNSKMVINVAALAKQVVMFWFTGLIFVAYQVVKSHVYWTYLQSLKAYLSELQMSNRQVCTEPQLP